MQKYARKMPKYVQNMPKYMCNAKFLSQDAEKMLKYALKCSSMTGKCLKWQSLHFKANECL